MLNFFKKKDKPAEPTPVVDEEIDPELEAAAMAAAAEHEDEDAVERSWARRAAAVIPGGASTGSKRVDALWGEGAGRHGPTHFVAARGCEVVTVGERELIDCTMALGAAALGYGDSGVTDAVRRALAAGHVSGLSSVLEVTVAERLCEVIPCAERVRFLKTGAEATAAAVRIARAATGRSKVVGAGYFGWLDWCSTATGTRGSTAGVPAGVRADFTAVPFGDVDALRAAVAAAGRDLACIVIEPVVERMPPLEWMQAARALCDGVGALLVFDEVKTGFRVATGGWQATAGAVVPDLASVAKSLSNGFALGAVVGRAAPMDEGVGRTWISSTLASEAVALAAADAVLDRHAAEDVCGKLGEIGREMRAGVEAAIATSGITGVRVDGIDQMWFLRFDDARDETRFLEHAADRGVLFKRGAYNYVALPHEPLLADIEAAASQAFVSLVEERERGDADDEDDA